MNDKNLKTNVELKVTQRYFDYVTFQQNWDDPDGDHIAEHTPYYLEIVEDSFLGLTRVHIITKHLWIFNGTYNQFKENLKSFEDITPVFANEIIISEYYKTRRYTYKYDPSAPTSKDLESKLKAMNSIIDLPKGKKITKDELQKLIN